MEVSASPSVSMCRSSAVSSEEHVVVSGAVYMSVVLGRNSKSSKEYGKELKKLFILLIRDSTRDTTRDTTRDQELKTISSFSLLYPQHHQINYNLNMYYPAAYFTSLFAFV